MTLTPRQTQVPLVIEPCKPTEHEWANEDSGRHIEARCIVCLMWINDLMAVAPELFKTGPQK